MNRRISKLLLQGLFTYDSRLATFLWRAPTGRAFHSNLFAKQQKGFPLQSLTQHSTTNSPLLEGWPTGRGGFLIHQLPMFALRTPLFVLRTPLFVLRTSMFALRTPLFTLRTPMFVLRTPMNVLRTPMFVLRTLLFALRTQLFVLRTPTNKVCK